jgi:hypothetical protein
MKSLKLDPSQRGKKCKGSRERDFPLPRGAAFKEVKGPPDRDELAKLMATKRARKLVPERSPILDRMVRQLGPLVHSKEPRES